MRFKRSRRALFIAPLIFTICLLLNCLFMPVVSAEEKISQPGQYSGYTPVLYDSWVRSSQYVTVSDGTKLAVDLYRPAMGGEVVKNAKHPVIFNFTPYGRATKNPDGTLRLAGVTSYGYQGGLVSLIKYGYTIAIADVRGLGASYGFRKAANDRTEAKDAYDMVEWLAEQDFCDGNVAMWGGSYHGQTVLCAIETMPPHLKAAYFGITNWNFYDAWGRGGIPRGSEGEEAPDPVAEMNKFVPVDGDLDGPDDDDYPDMMWEAVNQHLQNGPITGLLLDLPYRNSTSDMYENGVGAYWEESSASNYLKQIKKGRVPAYVFGGWYDFLRRDTIMTFNNWPNPVKMIVTQGRHADSIALPGQLNQLAEVHRFFDYWLKGVQNGVMDEPPVYYTTLDTPVLSTRGLQPKVKTWQFASQWPLSNTRKVKLFLSDGISGSAASVNDGTLSLRYPKKRTNHDDYLVDYSVKTDLEPVYVFPVPSGAEFDAKGLTYTTEELSDDVVIDGFPKMNLWASSDSKDADFIVLLEDIFPDGTSAYVSDGRLRASLRKINKPAYDFLGLPWHRAYDKDERKLVPGKPVKLEMAMMPTSYTFRKDHRIRLTIVCSQGKIFNLDPATDEDAPASVKIYRNRYLASNIDIPVKTRPNLFSGTANIERKGVSYNGPAQLYLGSKAVFMKYDDQWIKWDRVKYKNKKRSETYMCHGPFGKLMVKVNKNSGDKPESVVAFAKGFSFTGDGE